MKAPDIRCPYCGSNMVSGAVVMKQSFTAMLSHGTGSGHTLEFVEDGAEKMVMSLGQSCAGHRCGACACVTAYPMTREWTQK